MSKNSCGENITVYTKIYFFFYFGHIFIFQSAEFACGQYFIQTFILLIFRAKKNIFSSSYLAWKLQEAKV